MEFTLRDLEASDLFVMVKILNKIGIKKFKESIDINSLKETLKKLKEDETLTEVSKKDIMIETGMAVSMDVLTILLEHLPNIETDLYRFAGSLSGLKYQEVGKLKINDFIGLLTAIVRKEEFKDFFNQASKLIK